MQFQGKTVGIWAGFNTLSKTEQVAQQINRIALQNGISINSKYALYWFVANGKYYFDLTIHKNKPFYNIVINNSDFITYKNPINVF